MFHRYCLLCLILSCRLAIGRLPKDATPIYTNTDNSELVAVKFSGVHNIEDVHGTFYVLSKNNVSSVHVNVKDTGDGELKIDQVISWDPPSAKVINCKRKVSDPTACDNYIRIFAPKRSSGREFIVCGTHSTDPQCRTYLKQGNSFSRDTRKSDFSGTSICPFTPTQTGASLYTGGDLYTATLEDLLGRKPGIYRRSVVSSRKDLQRAKTDESWLVDPRFVKFVETTPKVYIFFKETAIEDKSGLTYTRVGQMCKGEAGGDRILRRQFTSFVKARLNCSYAGDPPFYFNEIAAASDFYHIPGNVGQRVLFAAMNTPKNSIWGSAVCAYTEEDIERTMQGPFLERHMGDNGMHYWLEKESDPAVTNALSSCQYGESGKSVLSVENLQFIRDHPLKSRSIPSWNKPGRRRVPLFMKLHAQYQFSAITVDPSVGSSTQYLVLLLGTTDGKLLKVIPPLMDGMEEAHFIEESNVYDETQCDQDGDRQVRDIKTDKNSGYILIAFSSCVVSVPMCPHRQSTCESSCIKAQDPYCAWDSEEKKCFTVLRTNDGKQDVLGEHLDELSPCLIPPIGTGDSSAPEDGDVEPLVSNSGNTNVTASEIINTRSTTPPEVAAAFFEMNWVSLCIGLAIGIAIILLVGLILCRCRKSRMSIAKNSYKEQNHSTRQSNHSNDVKRNSYSQKQDRPLSNHTQRHHSKRSDSSVEDDTPFIDDRSDGNSNSIDKKSKRKRELSTNRRSNSSSYRREDSMENVPMHPLVNRQISKESNESGLNMNGDMIVDATQPPSPPGMHRTMSATTAPTSRPAGRDLKRQLSLQIPNSSHPQMINFPPHSLTPLAMSMNQNPFDYQIKYAQTPGPMQSPHFDPTGASWHQSPMKNSKAMPGQHQTTSLDRKMLRAAGQYNRAPHVVPHDVQQQQQPRGYADTLPSHGMDDPRAQGRKRYPSESVVSNHRPYVAKPPGYQSIEEEATPVPDSPTKFPPNMHQRTANRMRPNQLSLGDNYHQFQPPNSTTTPLLEQTPSYIISPTQPSGHTLPIKQIRRVNSEIPVLYTNQPNHDQLPHPQSAPTFPKDYYSKSNPTTPDVDPNHNSFFRDQVDPSQVRKRTPSGKSITSPSNKELPDRPDVIPAATQPVETTHLEIRQNDQTV